MQATIANDEPDSSGRLPAGTRLGAHVILQGVLGEGGTAIVYEALHTELDRTVAVKMLHVGGARAREARARLLREARICETIQSWRVPKVYFLDELEDGTPYMVMEKIEGPTLSSLLERGPLPLATASNIVEQLLEALAAIHAHGVVHRDIKPSNLILQPMPNGTVRLRLMDFGIGKIAAQAPEVTSITRQGDIIGTPCYMAPEQLTATGVDARVDLYSAGIVLYELVTGKVPFHANSLAEVVAAVLRDAMPSLRSLRSDAPVQLEEVVAKATAKDPSVRYASAERMKLALRAALRASRVCGARSEAASSEARARRQVLTPTLRARVKARTNSHAGLLARTLKPSPAAYPRHASRPLRNSSLPHAPSPR